MRRARIAVAVLLSAAVAAPAAHAQEPPGKKSELVSHVGFLPEPGVISARFKDSLMYVSSVNGLSIYDVKNPAAPARIGRLDLPNFENEDIDVGNGVALISNDPNEGVGQLWVIDVRDPTKPAILSSLFTGTADAGVFSQFFGTPTGSGTGHTASCVQDCKFVYLAGSLPGVVVVDLRNPAEPKFADLDPLTPGAQPGFAAAEATGLTSHDVQFDVAGRAWVVGHGGTAAYDITDPLRPVLVARTNQDGASTSDGVTPNDGTKYNDFIHHNSMRVPNSSLAALPAQADVAADSNVVAVTEEDYNRPTCEGAGSFETWAISQTETRRGGASEQGAPVPVVKPLDKWDVEVDPSRQTLCSAHYFDLRGGLVAQGWYEQGVRFLDISDPADIRQVGYFVPQKSLTWGALYPPTDPTGEVVYALDNVRGIDVLRFDRPDPPVPGVPSTPADLKRLPTVVAPPADGPGVTKDEVPGRARSGRRPNVALRISDGRRTARAGQRLRWRVELRHVGGEAADDLVVRVDLPRVVTRVRAPGANVRGRRLTYRLDRLGQGARRTFFIGATVRRPPRARAVLVRGLLGARDDADVRDNRATDRDPITRRRRSRSRAAAIAAFAGTERASVTAEERRRAEADHRLASGNHRLRTAGEPGVDVEVQRAARSAYGLVCRLVGF